MPTIAIVILYDALNGIMGDLMQHLLVDIRHFGVEALLVINLVFLSFDMGCWRK